ncbi:uncharacterized protein LOC144799653 isoform X2 [Lissotriton helveticus]
MLLHYLQLLVLLGAAGLSVVFWQHSLSWQSTAQQCLAKVGGLEKHMSTSQMQVQKLERRVAEETVRADDMQHRLSNEGAQLVAAQEQLDRVRTSLNACIAEKMKLKQQKQQEINQIRNVKGSCAKQTPLWRQGPLSRATEPSGSRKRTAKGEQAMNRRMVEKVIPALIAGHT